MDPRAPPATRSRRRTAGPFSVPPTYITTGRTGTNHAPPPSSPPAAAAQDDDIVLTNPGTSYDCAIWRAQRLPIQGQGADTVITDTPCQGKALFILAGDAATVRDLTLTRARVPDGNGAGIRLEAPSLTLQNVRFVNNEVGLLTGSPGPGQIRITDCLFEAGGVGGDRPMFAGLVNGAALLQIDRSIIRTVKGGG